MLLEIIAKATGYRYANGICLGTDVHPKNTNKYNNK